MKLKKGDNVLVISGKDKGQETSQGRRKKTRQAGYKRREQKEVR